MILNILGVGWGGNEKYSIQSTKRQISASLCIDWRIISQNLSTFYELDVHYMAKRWHLLTPYVEITHAEFEVIHNAGVDFLAEF